MRVNQFNVPADVKRALSPQVLEDVIAQFQPEGDCYVCHRPLGTVGRFSLRVDDNGPIAVAVPAHAPCHASTAQSVAALGLPAGTYRTLPVGIPVTEDGQNRLLPIILVNPTVDVITLTRGADGLLRDNRESTLLGDNWVRYGSTSPVHDDTAPVGSVTAPARAGGDWTVSTVLGTWTVDLPPEVVAAVREHRSLFVFALFTTPVAAIHAADDPLRAVISGITAEPAMLGRCELKP